MKLIKIVVFIFISLLFIDSNQVQAQVYPIPGDIAARLLVKVIDFEKNISKKDITIYVQGAPDIAKALQKYVGQAGITEVLSGSSLPTTKPTIYFVSNAGYLADVIKYTRNNKVLSVSNYPAFVETGITLGFGVGEDKKVKILLNVASSEEEGLEWKPAIMKVAQIVQQ